MQLLPTSWPAPNGRMISKSLSSPGVLSCLRLLVIVNAKEKCFYLRFLYVRSVKFFFKVHPWILRPGIVQRKVFFLHWKSCENKFDLLNKSKHLCLVSIQIVNNQIFRKSPSDKTFSGSENGEFRWFERWFAVLFGRLQVSLRFQENLSVKVIPTMPEKLNIPSGAMGPTDKDVLAQLNAAHPLQISEAKVRITTTKTCAKLNHKLSFPFPALKPSAQLAQYDDPQSPRHGGSVEIHDGA